MSDEEYLQGWNDRRVLETALLDAFAKAPLTNEQHKLLSDIRESLTNEGVLKEENDNKGETNE